MSEYSWVEPSRQDAGLVLLLNPNTAKQTL
jgi:hypothetical protein